MLESRSLGVLGPRVVRLEVRQQGPGFWAALGSYGRLPGYLSTGTLKVQEVRGGAAGGGHARQTGWTRAGVLVSYLTATAIALLYHLPTMSVYFPTLAITGACFVFFTTVVEYPINPLVSASCQLNHQRLEMALLSANARH